MQVSQLTIDEFLTRLGSSDPTPGGGSLSAIAGAMAAAMLAMVCNLTVGRPRFAEVEEEVRALLDRALAAQDSLVKLADADVEAYLGVRDAYRLPRGDEAEQEERNAAIQHSMRGATLVPVKTSESARRVLDLALAAADSTNPAALGDVAVAAHLAVAATRGAADQARLNLASIDDPGFVSTMRECLAASLGDLDALVRQILETVDRRAPKQ